MAERVKADAQRYAEAQAIANPHIEIELNTRHSSLGRVVKVSAVLAYTSPTECEVGRLLYYPVQLPPGQTRLTLAVFSRGSRSNINFTPYKGNTIWQRVA